MHCKQLNTSLLIVLGCLAACGAVRAPLGAASAAQGGFQCGAPNGPCGAAIPAGVQCPKGPGWCQAGHYCGWSKNADEASRCLPLPESCGKAGHACCPSNTDSPHTSLEDKLSRKPFCKDGSYCLYWPPLRGGTYDIYAANTGADWGSPGALPMSKEEGALTGRQVYMAARILPGTTPAHCKATSHYTLPSMVVLA